MSGKCKLFTAQTASALLSGNSGVTITSEGDGVYVDGQQQEPAT